MTAAPPQPSHDGDAGVSKRADAAFLRSNGLIDRSMFVFGLCALVGSVLMSPDPEMLTLFGFDVPVMCGFRALTGTECMGCGLTRSFAYMGHLQPLEAFAMHKAGPFAWLALVGQLPYRGWKLWRGRGYGTRRR